MKKKLIIVIIAAIVVLGGGIGGYVYHSNQVKAEKMANYKKALSDYRFNSNRLIYSLDFVATDFIINWNSAIMNKKAMNAKNEIVPCSDFEDAVSSRYAFYDKYGAYKILDSVYVSLWKAYRNQRQRRGIVFILGNKYPKNDVFIYIYHFWGMQTHYAIFKFAALAMFEITSNILPKNPCFSAISRLLCLFFRLYELMEML